MRRQGPSRQAGTTPVSSSRGSGARPALPTRNDRRPPPALNTGQAYTRLSYRISPLGFFDAPIIVRFRAAQFNRHRLICYFNWIAADCKVAAARSFTNKFVLFCFRFRSKWFIFSLTSQTASL